VGAQGLQQERGGAVELVAEAPPPPGDDLVDQAVLGERDGLGQVDAQVLKRHGHQVRAVQIAERRLVEDPGAAHTDPV
jgi:hypothetical protein